MNIKLKIAKTTIGVLTEMVKILERDNYKINRKLVVFVPRKRYKGEKRIVVGTVKETRTHYIIKEKNGNELYLFKGDDTSYSFYDVIDVLDALENQLITE